ncbi:MAG: phenylacetate--CoA ligase [Clostridia bacterium]|nr:phenylacetate--CoA ligase [Clostridia bacterium]
MIWNKVETVSKDELHAIQSERLIKTVNRVYDNVGYYRKKMDAQGILPGDIKSIDDLSKLPFTDKYDLAENYPFGTFAAPMSEVVRFHASSGTTGKPKVAGYTRNDLAVWSECVARCLTMAGMTKEDMLHVAFGYGLFTGGFGLHQGSELIGAATIPVSGGNTERQITILTDFKPTYLCCTPSYALYIASELERMGKSKEDLNLKAGIFGAEPWTDEMKAEIEKKLGLKAYDIYGLTEITGPGVSMCCDENNGLHVCADHFVPEIINPDTLLPEGDNTVGELVFTTISKEAFPLIRYRTRDLTSIDSSPCACGRTSPRMARIMGRSDDMLIIRGVNVFPSQIESVILKSSDVAPYYMIYVDREGLLDTMKIKVEMNSELFSDEVKKIEAVERKLRHDIESVIGISASVELVEARTLPRFEGKAKHVIDNRKLYK